MNIKISQKIIKEMCGTASFKRGEAFCRGKKVTFQHDSLDSCEATVTGTEDFHVSIKKEASGTLQATCTCPKLTSFQKDCQHVAAVLLSIYHHQLQGIPVAVSGSKISENQELTNGLFTLFKQKQGRSSTRQNHFEQRKVLDLLFLCKLVRIGEQYQIGLEVQVGINKILHIREFLKDIKAGRSSALSMGFTYDPNLHCFQNEDSAVLEQLIGIMADEKVYMEAQWDRDIAANNQLLMVPPTAFGRLFPILKKASFVILELDGNIYDPIRLSNDKLSLQFHFTETEHGGYSLQIHGLSQFIILESYQLIFHQGTLFQLKRDDFKRLLELKQMVEASGKDQIPILLDQVPFFMEKVVPGLQALGDVHLPNVIVENLKTPLKAKVYLDRVNNRLLAGLEFHYAPIIINPLENRELKGNSKLIRDVRKEEQILKMMEDSSFAKTDSGYILHNEELEYEFLYHILPKLRVMVQVYATTAIRNRIFKGHARPRIRVKVNKDRINWLDFKFEMEGIPDQHIRDVLVALEEKRKYYRLKDGSLLSLEAREFDELKRFLNTVPVDDDLEDLEAGLNVPIIRGFQLLDSVDDPNIFTLEASFRQFLDEINHPERLEIEIPAPLVNVLRDYQKHGYRWMKTLAHYGFGGILADSMGIGKTLQSIAYILSEMDQIRIEKTPILIVCPSSLTYNWLSELMKFTPDIEAAVIDGKKEERAELQKEAMDSDVLITSYPLLRKDIKWYEKQPFHTVFFDEAQAFKNPITETARAVKKIQANHCFALTGTPVENSLEELWSIFHVVFPELFQGLKEFSNLTRGKISRRIRPFLLRRMKEDVLKELPSKKEIIESTDLLPEQKKLYAAYLAKLRHDTLKHLDKDTIRKNRIRILAGLTRLRQICCHPALFVDGYKGSSAKLDQLLKIIEEAKNSGRRVLIFSQFTKMLEIIGRELAIQGLPFFYLDGQTPSQERVETCNRFNRGERDYFLISLKAGGTGLNLTGADTVILYDLWWNPAVEEQAADRAHRIGQTNTVEVIKLVARGTIEEKMNELQDKKRHLIKEIIDPEDRSTSALTDEDIKELLMIK